jgi:diguanylate cyclase (GGDEF)-like protein
MYDSLTGLARREFFAQMTRRAVAHANRHKEVLSLMFVDLDGFKEVNDALGHAAGDRLLKEVGARLRDTLREDDSLGRGQLLENEDRIARLGGDEFTVLLTKLTLPENAGLVAQRMLYAVAAPYLVDGQEVVVTISIGIAVFPQDGSTPEALLKSADLAMYTAKKEGKNTYRYHSRL